MPRFESGGGALPLRASGHCKEKGGVEHDSSKIRVNAWGTTVEGIAWTGEHNVTCEVDVEPGSYAEIEVTALPAGAVVAVGFNYAAASTVVGTDTLPGWSLGTIGIHSDDGKVYCGNKDLSTLGIQGFTFQQGDIVGTEFKDSHFMLTLNGKVQCCNQVTGGTNASARPKLLLGFDHPATRLSINTSGQRLLYCAGSTEGVGNSSCAGNGDTVTTRPN
jgi:hypothetical protein